MRSLLLDNPVFRREARSRIRHLHKSVRAQLGAAAVLGALIVVCYGVVFHTAVRYRFSGMELWLGAVWLQLLAGVGLLPALMATSVSVERQQGSLELLLATPLTSAEIILGKFFARMVIIGMLAAGVSPFEIVAPFFGDLPPGRALGSLLILASTLTAVGAIALYCSVKCRATATAVAVAYSAVGAWLILPLLTSSLLRSLVRWGGEDLAQLIERFSPFAALLSVTDPQETVAGFVSSSLPWNAQIVNPMFAALAAAGALYLSIALLRRETRP